MGKFFLGLGGGITLMLMLHFRFGFEADLDEQVYADDPASDAAHLSNLDFEESRETLGELSSLADSDELSTTTNSMSTPDQLREQLASAERRILEAQIDRDLALNELKALEMAELDVPDFAKKQLELPPEFAWASEGPYSSARQSIQEEPIDPAWASTMEFQLQSYFSRNTALIAKYGQPTIHCRTTRCELRFLSYGNSILPTSESWNADLPDLFEQPWASELIFPTIVSNQNDGVTTVLWHIARKSVP